jgi:rare lipoprotein A
MNRISVLALAASLFGVAPAYADNSGNAEWLNRSFGGASASGGKGSKAAPSATASSGSSFGGGGGGGETGIASYYWQPQAVASGGRFNPNAMTAAHKTLPFGTRVRVTSLSSGRSVEVVINDRGPYVAGRVIDLSRRAAENLGMTGAGLAKVSVQRL